MSCVFLSFPFAAVIWAARRRNACSSTTASIALSSEVILHRRISTEGVTQHTRSSSSHTDSPWQEDLFPFLSPQENTVSTCEETIGVYDFNGKKAKPNATVLHQAGHIAISRGVTPITAEYAAECWQEAIDKFDHLESKFGLGSLYMQLQNRAMTKSDEDEITEDQGVSQSQERKRIGLKYLKEAAASGHAWAHSNLGLVYWRGNKEADVAINKKKAVEHLEKAWQLGKIAVAPFNIYNILMEEANAPYVTEDSLLQRAQEWLVIAAEQAHDVTAQYQLGCIIRDGKCVIKPPRTAYEYFKESADRGYVYSQFNAAKCLIDGTHGAEKSPKIAMHYYRMASNQGFGDATLSLGLMYLQGIGLDAPDFESAKVYFAEIHISGEKAQRDKLHAFLSRARTKNATIGK